VHDFGEEECRVSLVKGGVARSGQAVGLFGEREGRAGLALAGKHPGPHAQAAHLRPGGCAVQLQAAQRPLLGLFVTAQGVERLG